MRTHQRQTRPSAAALVLALSTLGGCGGSDPNEANVIICPQVAVVRALSQARVANHAEMIAKITRGDGECTVNENEQTTKVAFDLTVEAARIPELTEGNLAPTTAEIPYVVALVAPDNTVRLRQPLTAQNTFEKDGLQSATREPVEVIVPAMPPESAQWRVLFGIAVAEDTLSAALKHDVR